MCRKGVGQREGGGMMGSAWRRSTTQGNTTTWREVESQSVSQPPKKAPKEAERSAE